MILDAGKRMKPMEVLLTSTDNPYTTQLGGKHIHLLLLEQGLKALNLQVFTLYYNPKSLKEFAKKSMLIPFPEKYRYKFKLKWMMDYLARRIPKNYFDIIHAHDVMSILAVSKMPQKKVLTLHGYSARENIEFIRSEKDRKAVYPLLLGMEIDAMKYADHVITVDERLKEYVMSQFKTPAERITVMHNAIDTSRFRPISEEDQRELKKTSGYDADDYVILVPRRLVEKNGVIYAVKAMKKVGSENARMIIAGDGPERKSIVKEARENHRIYLAGSIPHDKIDSYYRMADIILIPSITSHGVQEASSLAMLEGMACGKVVICSDIGGMHEIIQNVKTGMLVREGNPVAIAGAVETVMENQSLRVAIGKRAREYVLQNHSFVTHAGKVAQIYRSVIQEPNR
jgi:glycosyltransferase involved in cell wall biosynthesis